MGYEKVILFDGKDLSRWTQAHADKPPAERPAANWIIGDDGAMTVNDGNIVSTETYGDAHIHVEFWLPYMPEAQGQARANSGVYVHGCYEIQVLDSYGVENPTCSDCGGIYSLYAPLTNANLKPEEWQTYDIYIYAPRFNENGDIIEDGRLTLLLNGIVVQNNVILHSHTPGGMTDYRVAEGPLMLQDHSGDRVRYRNIWFERL